MQASTEEARAEALVEAHADLRAALESWTVMMSDEAAETELFTQVMLSVTASFSVVE